MAGLLGININRRTIKIRLRPAHSPECFYPYTHLLGTMVHELAHMKHSNHSSEFYAFMDKLHDEVEADQKKPLFQPGVKLAGDQLALGDTNRNLETLSKEEARRRRADAVIKRLERQAIMGSTSGGNRLGGVPPPVTREELRRVSAEAADRRLRDNVWCPSESQEEGGSDQGDEDDLDDVEWQSGELDERGGPRVGDCTDTRATQPPAHTVSSSSSSSSKINDPVTCPPCGNDISKQSLVTRKSSEVNGDDDQPQAKRSARLPSEVIDLITPQASDDEEWGASSSRTQMDSDDTLAVKLQKELYDLT